MCVNEAVRKRAKKTISDEDNRYLLLLERDYQMCKKVALTARSKSRMSLKDIYLKLDAAEKLVIELQSHFVEATPESIAWLFSGNTMPRQSAYEFLRVLYLQNTTRAINSVFVKKCELVRSKLNEC